MSHNQHVIACAVPVTTAFTSPHGGFRNCCLADPALHSRPTQNFVEWWTSQELQAFRDSLTSQALPKECYRCQVSEQVNGQSYRQSVNSQVDLKSLAGDWPSRWNVQFGNTCNLACWSCSEKSSSVIETHKRRIGILPADHVSPAVAFDQQWPALRAAIMQSYQHHETIHLTILGGEPLYNDHVLDFLNSLSVHQLTSRTRLEFHTNATRFHQRIRTMLAPGQWQYVSVFLSLDSVGRAAEWLRYGSDWSQIENNVEAIKTSVDYCEVHCTLSILNIMDLADLKQWCATRHLPLKIFLLAAPAHMALSNWDDDPEKILSMIDNQDPEFESYYSMIGSIAQSGSRDSLRQYIQQFDSIRKPLADFNPKLHAILHG